MFLLHGRGDRRMSTSMLRRPRVVELAESRADFVGSRWVVPFGEVEGALPGVPGAVGVAHRGMGVAEVDEGGRFAAPAEQLDRLAQLSARVVEPRQPGVRGLATTLA